MENFSIVVTGAAVATLVLAGPGPAVPDAMSTGQGDMGARIVAAHDGRTLLAKGDRAWVRGDLGCARHFRVLRRLPVGHGNGTAPQLTQVGEAVRLDGSGAPASAGGGLHAILLTASTQEVALGDVLVPTRAASAPCTA